MKTPGVTVCVPSIPPRGKLFDRAIKSAWAALEVLEAAGVSGDISVNVDWHKRGAAWNRDQCLRWAKTQWVAFLDDDDEMDHNHLVALWTAAQEHDADYLWSRFRIGFPDGSVQAGPHPLGAGTFQQWNDAQPAQTTVTTMVRRELALDVGGFSGESGNPEDGSLIDGQRVGEDWLFTLACRDTGATFRHVPEVTWTWHHHQSNTSGLPSRW